jgi:putative heme-binding domain-containing protein
VHLLKLLAERTDWHGTSAYVFDLVRGRLADNDAFVRRAAAEALGRHPDPANVPLLLSLWDRTPPQDAHLIHMARMALRDQLLTPGMYDKVAALTSDARTAGQLAEVSLGAHTAESAAWLLQYVKAHPIAHARLGELVHEIARYLPDARLTEMDDLAGVLASQPRHVQRAAAEQIHRGLEERGRGLSEALTTWTLSLGQELLESADRNDVQSGLELARQVRLPQWHEPAARHAGRAAQYAELRPLAIDACAACDPERSRSLLVALVGDAAEPMPLRQKAASALGGMNTPASRRELSTLLKEAPATLAVDIATALARSRPGAEQLLTMIEQGQASPRLLQESPVQQGLRGASIPDLAAIVTRLTAGLPPADARVNELIAARRAAFLAAKPDLAQGRQAYQRVCAACHRLGGAGVKIGPELDGIGQRGLERLLEDLLDPSRNVDQAFRSLQIITKAGQVVVGLKLREEGQVLILADPQGKEIRVPLADIDQQETTPLSPMPGNVNELLKPEEFHGLIEFLLQQRQAKPG